MFPIAGEPESFDVMVLFVAPITIVIIGYLLLRRAKGGGYRRTGSIVIAVVATMFGTLGMVGYAIPALDDLKNPAVSFRTALIGNFIIRAICLGAFVFAFRAAWEGFGSGDDS